MCIRDSFLTDFALLRGLPRIRLVPGEVREFDYLDMQNLPGDSNKKGKLRVVGQETLTIEGRDYPCWKLRWKVTDGPSVALWYGENGQMLRKVERKEEWLFSPTRTAKQDVSLPNIRPDEPAGKKKGTKKD